MFLGIFAKQLQIDRCSDNDDGFTSRAEALADCKHQPGTFAGGMSGMPGTIPGYAKKACMCAASFDFPIPEVEVPRLVSSFLGQEIDVTEFACSSREEVEKGIGDGEFCHPGGPVIWKAIFQREIMVDGWNADDKAVHFRGNGNSIKPSVQQQLERLNPALTARRRSMLAAPRWSLHERVANPFYILTCAQY